MSINPSSYRDPHRLLRHKASLVAQQSGPVPSPCISVCRMDSGSGWCTGCLRTLDEIVQWSRASDAEKRQIWLHLAQRALPTTSNNSL
jgi:predicted Fe-S protein YdhL (DUF1289 family)